MADLEHYDYDVMSARGTFLSRMHLSTEETNRVQDAMPRDEFVRLADKTNEAYKMRDWCHIGIAFGVVGAAMTAAVAKWGVWQPVMTLLKIAPSGERGAVLLGLLGTGGVMLISGIAGLEFKQMIKPIRSRVQRAIRYPTKHPDSAWRL